MTTSRRPVDLCALGDLLKAGRTYPQVAQRLGISINWAWKLATRSKLARRRRALPRRLRRKVERLLASATLSQSAIARQVGIAKSTVSAWKGKPRLRPIAGVGQVARLRTPRRCANGHRTMVWPCLQCVAERRSSRTVP